MKTVILLNRGGGSAADTGAVEEALASAGIDAKPRWLEGKDIAEAAKAGADDGAGRIIVGGGDGTVSAAAGALAGSDALLGVLPLGTLNHFARDLGLPLDPAEAARVIAAGRSRKVDVAEVNGRTFVNNSAIGLYPLMVTDRQSQQKRLGRKKRLAMLVAALRTIARFSSRRLTIQVDDQRAQVETPLLFVGNNAYRLEMPGAGTRERLDRGELCVVLLRRKSRLGLFLTAFKLLLGRDRRADAVTIDGVHLLNVDSRHEAITISLDGETLLMQTPLEYRIRPKALTVIVP